MKRAHWWLGLLAACGLVAGNTWAEPERKDIATLDGVTWIYTVDGGNATVTGVVTPAQGVLTMPSTLGGCPVTDIDFAAFSKNNNIAVMNIPDSVRNIAESAFEGCTGLQAVTIGNNVTNIEQCAFEGCTSLSAVTFGKRLQTIGPAAFKSCEKLTTVKLPDSVKVIGEAAFSHCGVASVTLGKGLETIGDYAFEACDRMETLNIPDNVKNIGERAFLCVFFLRNITLPNSVTNLGVEAFGMCVNLKSVVLPDNLTILENNLFSNCVSLVDVTIPDSVRHIGDGTFWSCEDLTELAIPANVTNIGENAFAYCTNLVTLHVPTSLRESLSHAGIPLGCTLDFYVNRQTVLFDANGGSCETPNRIFELDVPYASFPEATREHHVFAGWWTEATGGERVLESDIVQAVEFRTLYAHWTLVKQVVTFAPNGGQCDTTTKEYSLGKTYAYLPSPAREHHAFAGWWTEVHGGEQVTAATTVTEKEFQTLYAHWMIVEQVVSFECEAGKCDMSNRVYRVGGTYSPLPGAIFDNPQVAFVGWHTRDGENISEATVVEAKETLTLQAHGTFLEEVEKKWVDSCVADENGEFIIRFSGEKGKLYALQRTSVLGESAVWHIVTSILAERDGEMELKSFPPENWERGFFRVVEVEKETYLIVDMSRGQDADHWPMSYILGVPDDGWTDEYKTTKLVLRRIEPGIFVMGSPANELGRNDDEGQHEVTLTKPYFLGVFEVTQRQWELAMGNRPSYFANDDYYTTRPVEEVSYNDIRGASSGAEWPVANTVDSSSFLGVLRAKTGLEFDLPTEAQWEYACRAGTTTALNSGKDLTGFSSCKNLAAVGRYGYNSGYFPNSTYSSSWSTTQGTAKVGSYLPNAWGLYDMHGNVWERCLDWYGDFGTDALTNPVGATSGSYRVLRGGSCLDIAQGCRSADRYGNYSPADKGVNSGFRLCCPAELP